MSQTQILLYNFKDEDRLHQIRRYLNRHRISVRMVQQPEYLESLGFLFEIPGFSKNPVFNLGKNFLEENFPVEEMACCHELKSYVLHWDFSMSSL